MASLSRPFLIPMTLLFVTRVFAAPTEPLVDGDSFRYLEREELGPFPQDRDSKLSPGGAQFRSKLTAVLRRAVSSVPDKKSSGLSTGLIVLIVFASVFGAIIILGCTSLVLVHRARSSTKTSTSTSPTMSRSATMLSGSTLVSPSGTMDGRTLMQILADSGLPVLRHAVSSKEQEKLRVDKPKSPVPAVLGNPFSFRAGASRRLSTSSHIVVIDQKSATAAGAVFLEEKPKVPPVLAVPRFVSSSDAYGAEHVSPDYEIPVSAAYQNVSAGLVHPPAPSRQQTMQSICSTGSNDSIPPCTPASPNADIPHGPVSTALLLPHTSCVRTEPTSISHIAPKPANITPAGTLRVVNIKPKPNHRASSNGLARTVVQRNMLHLAHSSRTHATVEPVQHPFAASAVMSNGLTIHAPRPEILLRPPTLRVNTTGLHGQGM